MKFILIHRTQEYRGDHSADVEYVYPIDPEMKVIDLIRLAVESKIAPVPAKIAPEAREPLP